MTIQTKYFIEISDLIGVRFECANCHATVSIPFSGEIRTNSLRNCPYCNEGWAQLPEGSNIEATIKGYVDAIKKFQGLLQRRKEFIGDGGFSLMLEIKEDSTLMQSISQTSKLEP